MITLDYQTKNPRWGWRGMKFTDWNSYSLTIGFLTNQQHYKGGGDDTSWSSVLVVLIEGNEQQGAWVSEGRIQYYGNIHALQNSLPDLYAHSSAGKAGVTCRINSNDFVNSLVYDYGFIPSTNSDCTTANVLPPDDWHTVRERLQQHLETMLPPDEAQKSLTWFDVGFDM